MNFLNEIIKTGKPKQFPKDEILNEDDRLVRSWMSVEIKDKQGDIIPVSAIKKVLNTWFKRGATMIDQHTNRPIGKGLNWQEKEHPATGKQGIVLDYQVFKDYSIDDNVWNEIKDGKRTGLSIGGRSLSAPTMKKDGDTGEMGKYHKAIELYEVSPVDAPANQLSNTISLNYMAKSLKEEDSEKLLKDLQKGYSGEIEKPFAGFENFEACTLAQKEKGHNEDAATRICGFIMHKTEKKFMKPKDQESNEEEVQKEVGPGGHVPDKTGPHGAGEGPGEGKADGSGLIEEKKIKKEMVPGGIAEGKTIKDLETKYKSTEDEITTLLAQGIKVEREHTDDDKVAQEIAMDHLWEDKEYYTKLKSIEKADIKKCHIRKADIKKEWAIDFLKDIDESFEEKGGYKMSKNKRTKYTYTNKGWPDEFVKSVN